MRIVGIGESGKDRAMDSLFSAVPPGIVALVTVTFLLAGLVKGTVGLGLPSIAIGLLAVAMTPAQAAAIMIVPSLVTNIWQMLTGPHLLLLLLRLWSLLLFSGIGIFFSGAVLTSADARLAALGLGVMLLVYAGFGLSAIRFSVARRHEWWMSPLMGLLTGLVAGGTGVFVIPAGPYFQAIGLSKDELVQALGLSFTVSTFVLAVVLWRAGAMHLGNATGSVLAVLPALVGMVIGQRIRSLASEETFRRWFFMALLAIGAQQAIRNAF
jgi:uncharacterized membrane protein YfcA